jgi:hypothetical protein
VADAVDHANALAEAERAHILARRRIAPVRQATECTYCYATGEPLRLGLCERCRAERQA